MVAGTFFTSDLHLDHQLVAGIRGFADPAEHDAAVAERWAATVGPQDVVWVLGDLAVSSSAERIDGVLARIAALPGRKHLVPGNHDPVHPMHRGAHRWQRTYLEVFESVQAFARRRIPVVGPDGPPVAVSVLLSHFPYTGDHTDTDRAAQYRLRDEGAWLLHGHTHSPDRVSAPRSIHIGLDGWGLRPAEMGEVAELMSRSLRG